MVCCFINSKSEEKIDYHRSNATYYKKMLSCRYMKRRGPRMPQAWHKEEIYYLILYKWPC